MTFRLAGVELDDDAHKHVSITAMMPDVTIIDGDGREETPADDLPAYIARQIGLDPDALTSEQRADIDAFIEAHKF